jgi:hypothetical protein
MQSAPLRIAPQAPAGALTPQQERFNALAQGVAAARAAVAGWQARIDRSEQQLAPLRTQLHGALRAWAAALDAASFHAVLSRAERAQLAELARDAQSELQGEPDPSEETPAASQPAAPADENPDEPWRAAAEAAAAARERRAAQRHAARRSRQHTQAKKEASQSLREVYRKLASALHPDREPDTQERARKTALMQQANQAYETGNLLALLELQLQAEQIDMQRLAMLDTRRLDHYASVLQEQLAELQRESAELENWFRAAFGAPPGTGMPARKADRLITAEAQRLRADVEWLARQAKVLQDADATRDWLRALRQA